MTKQELIEKVAARIGQSLDPLAIEAVEATLAVITEQGEPIELHDLADQAPRKFEGENATLETYSALPDDDKRKYVEEAQQNNADWLERKFDELKAAWVMVVDGIVIAHGESLDSFPMQQELIALCQQTGKYPFIFVHPRTLAIEEDSTAWHSTKFPDDWYPAIKATLSGNSGSLTMDADLDTGARELFTDVALLTSAGVIQVLPSDPRLPSSHLGRGFDFTPYSLWIDITDEVGTSRRVMKTAVCVHDWIRSPFVQINPSRQALLGRGVLLDLKPEVRLRFQDQSTELHYVA